MYNLRLTTIFICLLAVIAGISSCKKTDPKTDEELEEAKGKEIRITVPFLAYEDSDLLTEPGYRLHKPRRWMLNKLTQTSYTADGKIESSFVYDFETGERNGITGFHYIDFGIGQDLIDDQVVFLEDRTSIHYKNKDDIYMPVSNSPFCRIWPCGSASWVLHESGELMRIETNVFSEGGAAPAVFMVTCTEYPEKYPLQGTYFKLRGEVNRPYGNGGKQTDTFELVYSYRFWTQVSF